MLNLFSLSLLALSFHEDLLILDSHLDTPLHFSRPGWNIMERHTFEKDLTHVDYPRMVQGGLDGGFWVIFTDQGPLTPQAYSTARDHALRRTFEIREMVARNHKQFELGLTADDAARITASGRRVVYQSIENSYPLGADLTLLKTFHSLGVRMVGLVHASNNQFADSSDDTTSPLGGLSPLGKQLVEEANRLGLVLDASHASDAAFDQMLALSKTPIVLSHSGLRSVRGRLRNIDDDRIRQLAAHGGVLQLAAVNGFYVVVPPSPGRNDVLNEYARVIGELDTAGATAMAARMRAEDKRYSVPQATFDDFMRALLHAIKVAGVDHVGLGIDWDGGAGLVGFEDVSALPRVTARLREAGYSREDIGKIMSGNLLRVMRQAEAYAGGR